MLTAYKGNIIEAKSPTELGLYPNHYLILEDGILIDILPELPASMQEAEVTDFGDALILQSFCDMHLHAPQYEMTGTGMDLPLLQWLNAYAFPTEARYKDPSYARKKYHQLAKELIANGTTRVSMFSTLHTPATLVLMEELEQAGATGLVGKVNMDSNAPDYLRETTQESIQETLRWLEGCRRFSRVKPVLTPRFAPSCSPELLTFLGKVKAERGLPVQSHLSENVGEIAFVKEIFPECGEYWQVYDKYGLFDSHTLMAHCVHSTQTEQNAMLKSGVRPVHCASSNNSLCSGISPVGHMIRQGIGVCMGSDVAGGTTLSMLKTIANSISASKDRYIMTGDESQVLSIEEAYYAATSAGQTFLGEGEGFVRGKALHAIVLDDTHLPLLPGITLRDRLLRGAFRLDDRNITAVISNGIRRK